MRLLFITDSMVIYGGIERVLVDKMNWLVEQTNYDVYLLTVDQSNEKVVFTLNKKIIYNDLDIRFYRQYNVPIWRRFLFNIGLHRLFRQRLEDKLSEILPDIIICIRIDYIRDIIKVKKAIPLIFESHSSCLSTCFDHDGWLRKVRIHYQKMAIKKVNMVVALTQGDSVEWKKITNNVVVIPNVIHLNVIGKHDNYSSRSIIFVGRDTEQKDLDSLMRIWKLVYQKHPEYILHVYGDTYRNAEGLVVHRPTCRMDDVYMNASVLLMTSRYEPFGLVILEAMSYGVPVVAFDCPYGPPEIIADGVNGFIIKNRNIKEFAHRVCQLIEDENLCVEMGKRGVQSSQRYHSELIMPQWIKLFNMIVGDSN